jgi:peptidoglycan-N-acetylglucosamine deacetylase
MTLRRVTFTFDNGPTPGITERVFDILDRAGILSTFFVIGRNLEDAAAAALARNARSAGHWIGNHTLTHTIALGDRPDADYAAREIGDAQALIGDLAHPDRLFRPYGNDGLIGPHLLSRAAIAYLIEHRFRTILWNSVPGDWKDPDGWVDRCIEQVASQEWSVVVLHDIQDGCLPRLPELLRRLGDMGVVFEQDYPEGITLTRSGQIASMLPSYIAD